MSDLLSQVVEARRRGRVNVDLRKAAAYGQQMTLGFQRGPLDYARSAEAILGDTKAVRGVAGAVLKPLAALGLAAGFLGLSSLAEKGRARGVEGDVVDRFRTEYIMGGRRTDEEWAQSGLEQKIRGLYKDLEGIAPDVAVRAPAALAAIRPVAQRPVSNFTEQEVKALIDAQKSMRDVKPLGGAKLQAVAPLFKLMS